MAVKRAAACFNGLRELVGQRRVGGFVLLERGQQGLDAVELLLNVMMIGIEHIKASRQFRLELAHLRKMVRVFEPVVAVQMAVMQLGGMQQAAAVIRPAQPPLLIFAR